MQSLTVHDEVAKKSWSGAELRELGDDLRRLEDACEKLFPSWTRLSPRALIDAWDGRAAAEHWARVRGTDHYFSSGAELRNFLELEKAAAGGELAIYTGPDSGVDRDEADVLTCPVGHSIELSEILRRLEGRGLAFRGGGRWRVEGGKESFDAASLLELAKAVREGAQAGVDVQRYKGLGEMNPGQLWESTMDPATRRLYQVKLEDEFRAEEIFTVLMSTGVEPRREYIERHALEATYLDV
jgi:DNA gyrase/topoisomerase IV subunit B